MWVRSLSVTNLRNIAAAELELQPGLNLLVGRNAQGKTSLLEAMALLARGRSFRTERLGDVAVDLGDGLGACFPCRQEICPYEDKRTPVLGTLSDGEEFCVRKLVDEEGKP